MGSQLAVLPALAPQAVLLAALLLLQLLQVRWCFPDMAQECWFVRDAAAVAWLQMFQAAALGTVPADQSSRHRTDHTQAPVC